MTGFALPTAYSEQTTDYQQGQQYRGCSSQCCYCCDKHHDHKQAGEESLFQLSYSQSIIQGVRIATQAGQKPGGRNAKVMGEHCLLACFLWLPQPAFLQHQRPSAQRQHCPLSGVPISSPHQSSIRKMPYRPIWGVRGGIFSVKIPSSQMTLAYVKLTIQHRRPDREVVQGKIQWQLRLKQWQ